MQIKQRWPKAVKMDWRRQAAKSFIAINTGSSNWCLRCLFLLFLFGIFKGFAMTQQGLFFFIIFMTGGLGVLAGLFGLWLKKHDKH